MPSIQQQASEVRDPLTATYSFANNFLVVSISRAVREMAVTYADFLKCSLSGQHDLPMVGPDDKPLYANMATFLLMGQLLQRASTMGISPDLDIDPEYIGFQQEDVKNTDTSCFSF
jgi:hypothetical protein